MEHLQLDSLGILRQTKVPPELAWLTNDEKHFLLEVLNAGPDGMHKRHVAKFKKTNPEALIRLDVAGLIQWERDKVGREMFVVLGWKGQDVATLLLTIARHESHKAARNAA